MRRPSGNTPGIYLEAYTVGLDALQECQGEFLVPWFVWVEESAVGIPLLDKITVAEDVKGMHGDHLFLELEIVCDHGSDITSEVLCKQRLELLDRTIHAQI